MSTSSDNTLNKPIYLCKLEEIIDTSNDERAARQMEVLASILQKLGYTMMSGEAPHFDELWAAHLKLQ